MEKSDAFKQNIMNFVYDSGFVTIENNIEADLMHSWQEFWYPSYVPDDLVLKNAEEKYHLLGYMSDESNRELRIEEFSLETSFTLDTDTTKIHDLKFDGKDSVYYEDNKNEVYGVIIKNDDNYVAVECSGKWKQSEIMKIAKGLVYIKNKNIDKK